MDLDGGGDRRACSSLPDSDSHYVIQKLVNGHPIPVYVTSRTDLSRNERNDFTETHRYSTRTRSKVFLPQSAIKSSIGILTEFLRCPICSDPYIETTTTNCGHKFCRQCIDQWKQQKSVCPICSTIITSQHRLYSDDQFVESQLEYLRPEFKDRFQDAQKKRLKMLMDERKSENMIKRLRRKLNDSVVYLKCKSTTSCFNKISLPFVTLINKLSEWNDKFYHIILGMMIGALLLYCFKFLAGTTQFIQYMWLAGKNYDGTIPERWLQMVVPNLQPNETDTKYVSLFTTLVEKLSFKM